MFDEETVETDTVGNRTVVILRDATDDIAVHEASPAPVDRACTQQKTSTLLVRSANQ